MTAVPTEPLGADPVADRRARDRRLMGLVAVLLATFLVYVPSLANGFTWDDRFAAMGSGPTAQPFVRSLQPLAVFGSNWWPQHAPQSQAYRPLTTLWFAMRFALCGDDAMIAHLLNVLLHTLTVLLCWRWLRLLGVGHGAALAGAAAFGLHAIHSESVCSLVGAAELLALANGLAAAIVLPRALAVGGRRRFAGLVGGALLLFLAMASKESGVAWAAVAPLGAILLAKARGVQGAVLRREGALLAAAAAVPTVVWLALRWRMLAAVAAGTDPAVGLLENPLLDLPALGRIASGFVAWGYGALLTLLPWHLSVDYGPNQLPVLHGGAAAVLVCGAAVGVGALLVATLRRAGGPRLPVLAAAVFFAGSAITSNVPVPVFMHFAERSYTTPSLAVALLVAAAHGRLRAGRARHIAGWVLVGWCACSVWVAVPRNFVFHDDETLILSEVRSSPDSVRLRLCAGVLCRRLGDIEQATVHLRCAAELAPDLPQAWLELAELAEQVGARDTARGLLDRAFAARPREVARYAARMQGLARRLAEGAVDDGPARAMPPAPR